MSEWSLSLESLPHIGTPREPVRTVDHMGASLFDPDSAIGRGQLRINRESPQFDEILQTNRGSLIVCRQLSDIQFAFFARSVRVDKSDPSIAVVSGPSIADILARTEVEPFSEHMQNWIYGGENILANPGFEESLELTTVEEDGEDAVGTGIFEPTSWERSPHGLLASNTAPGSGGFEVVQTVVDTELHSLRLNPLEFPTGLFAGAQQKLRVIPGGTYRASCRHAQPTGTLFDYSLVIRDANENLISTPRLDQTATATFQTFVINNIVIPDEVDEIIFRFAVVAPTTGNPDPSYLDTCAFSPGLPPATAGQILQDILARATTRGALSWLDISSFDATFDSDAQPWDTTLAMTIPAGRSIADVLNELANLGYVWRVVNIGGTWTLRVWNPGPRVDHTVSLGPVILEGRDVTGGEVGRQEPMATAVRAYGKGSLVATAESAPAIVDWDRREVPIYNRFITDEGTLQKFANRHLEVISQQSASQLEITGGTNSKPYVDWRQGARLYVTAEGSRDPHLVHAITTDISGSGGPDRYSVDLDGVVVHPKAAQAEGLRRALTSIRDLLLEQEDVGGPILSASESLQTLNRPVLIVPAGASGELLAAADFVASLTNFEETLASALSISAEVWIWPGLYFMSGSTTGHSFTSFGESSIIGLGGVDTFDDGSAVVINIDEPPSAPAAWSKAINFLNTGRIENLSFHIAGATNRHDIGVHLPYRWRNIHIQGSVDEALARWWPGNRSAGSNLSLEYVVAPALNVGLEISAGSDWILDNVRGRSVSRLVSLAYPESPGGAGGENSVLRGLRLVNPGSETIPSVVYVGNTGAGWNQIFISDVSVRLGLGSISTGIVELEAGGTMGRIYVGNVRKQGTTAPDVAHNGQAVSSLDAVSTSTAGRPSASAVGAGVIMFDTDLGDFIGSDGVAWSTLGGGGGGGPTTYAALSATDPATDATGAEIENLTDGSNADALHSHAATSPTYTDVSANDPATDVTGAELEQLTDGSSTTLHSHAGGGGGQIGGAYDIEAGSYTDAGLSDEFNAGTLDPQWTAVNATAGSINFLGIPTDPIYDLASRSGTLLVQGDTNSLGSFRIDQMIASGEQIVASLLIPSFGDQVTGNGFWVGIAVNNNDTGPDVGTRFMCVFDGNDAGDFRVTDGFSVLADLREAFAPGRWYMRMVRSGTQGYFFVSRDGITWAFMSDHDISALDNMWVFGGSAATHSVPVGAIWGCNWFRHVANINHDPW